MGNKRLAIAAVIVLLLAGTTVVLWSPSDEFALPPSRSSQEATDAPSPADEKATRVRAQEARVERERLARLAEFAVIPLAQSDFTRVPDAPVGDPVELPNVYREGDRVRLRRLNGSASLSYFETSVNDMRTRKVRDLYDVTYDVTMERREGEKIVGVEGEEHRHEGRYTICSYILNYVPVIERPVQIGARFTTDRLGRLQRGSFVQTEGTPLSPQPTFLGERGFGILPDRKVRHGSPGETWGTMALPNPFAEHITLGGQPFTSMPFERSREGGWRIEGGDLVKEDDGSWSRNASYELKLCAVENGKLLNTRYGGKPADISYYIQWKGSGDYMLQKQTLIRVDDLMVSIEVRVKTATMLCEWRGHSSLNFEMSEMSERMGVLVPPPICAKVTFVSEESDAVLLSVGSEDNVKVGYEFTIRRGDEYIGKVIIFRVERDFSSGYSKKEVERVPIKVGDDAKRPY